MTFDTERLLNTPIFALNQLGVFSNVGDFLKLSEENIAHQKTVAVQRIEHDVSESGFEEPERHSYREHLQREIDFRFDVALPMRVRYAALTAFTSTIEWSITALKPSFRVTKTPQRYGSDNSPTQKLF
jgi:hypothetical protein